MSHKDGPGEISQSPEARTKGVDPMASTSVQKATRKRIAREMALREAVDRYNHELMDDEERLLVLERIKRLQKSLAS